MMTVVNQIQTYLHKIWEFLHETRITLLQVFLGPILIAMLIIAEFVSFPCNEHRALCLLSEEKHPDTSTSPMSTRKRSPRRRLVL